MPVRYGGVTYPNLRYGGVNYANARYGGVNYPIGGGAPPGMMTLYERLVAVDGGSGHIIDVTLDNPIAGGNANQHYIYEFAPSYGTLNQAHPATMFIDTSIFWNERPRFNHNGGGADEYIVALHRGASTFALDDYLGALALEWSWFIINADTEEWIAWQANFFNAGGDAYIVYKGRTDIGQTTISGVRGFVDGAPVDPDTILGQHAAMKWTFEGVTAGSRMLMALINSDTFEPFP